MNDLKGVHISNAIHHKLLGNIIIKTSRDEFLNNYY